MNEVITKGSHPYPKCNGKWIVQVFGQPRIPFEITVIREDFKHGRQSWGWFDENKLIISESLDNDGVPELIWHKLIRVAEEVAAELNAKDIV